MSGRCVRSDASRVAHDELNLVCHPVHACVVLCAEDLVGVDVDGHHEVAVPR